MDKLEKAVQKAREARKHTGTTPAAVPHAPAQVVLQQEAPIHAPTVTVEEIHLKNNRVLAHRTRSKEADIFRILRTQILQIMNQSGYTTLAITSPNYGDGKTTIALNLALSIAHDLKQTALLVDLDLRKPNITRYLGIADSHGLSDHLLHDTPIPDCLMRLPFERLSILPSGHVLDNSSEVLGSHKMAALAQELKSRYTDRIIIYDMPPVLAQDDPIAFLPHVDAVLMIVRNGVTTTQDIKRSMNVLSGTNLIGTVLNN